MKKIVAVMLTSILSGCFPETTNYTKETANADIIEIDAPDTSPVGQSVAIQLSVRGENGCWSHLSVQQSIIDSRHIHFTGRGVFETSGTCVLTQPLKDTVVTVKPTLTGWYFIQGNNLDPYAIVKDSILIQ